MSYPYTVGEHDIPPGVTVCYVKDSRAGQIIRDGMDIDAAENLAEAMNENFAQDEMSEELDFDDE